MTSSAEDENIVAKVKKFFFANNSFSDKFEKWADENCDAIDLDAEEHKLEYTQLYEEFCKLFEGGIEDFINSQGSTPLEFYEQLRKATDADPESEDAFFAKILLASADYDIFIQMLRYQKEMQRMQGKK